MRERYSRGLKLGPAPGALAAIGASAPRVPQHQPGAGPAQPEIRRISITFLKCKPLRP